MKRQFKASLWQENGWVVAQCLEVDVASQGRTEEEALLNLEEALALHFEAPLATKTPDIRPIEVEVKLLYRKFDTIYMQHVYGEDFVNDLPVMTLAEDRLVFPVAGGPAPAEGTTAPTPSAPSADEASPPAAEVELRRLAPRASTSRAAPQMATSTSAASVNQA